MNELALAFFRIKFLETYTIKLLNFCAQIFGNYGVAIIVITILINVLLLPMRLKQEKATQKMQELAPKIDELKKKYKDDKATLNEKTAELYREENANPVAGCLPLLIQMPIFIALYYTFSGNTVPETANFLWFNLKRPDALFHISKYAVNILPLLSAGFMIVQQKLMMGVNKTDDPAAAQMQNTMMFLPVVLLLIFYKMPSGVNLYYLTNTIVSIFIQLYVKTKVRKK